MKNISRAVLAASLVVGLGGIAQAQSPARHTYVAPEPYVAVVEGRSGAVDQVAPPSGVVPPSESHTVMGLRVPR